MHLLLPPSQGEWTSGHYCPWLGAPRPPGETPLPASNWLFPLSDGRHTLDLNHIFPTVQAHGELSFFRTVPLGRPPLSHIGSFHLPQRGLCLLTLEHSPHFHLIFRFPAKEKWSDPFTTFGIFDLRNPGLDQSSCFSASHKVASFASLSPHHTLSSRPTGLPFYSEWIWGLT